MKEIVEQIELVSNPGKQSYICLQLEFKDSGADTFTKLKEDIDVMLKKNEEKTVTTYLSENGLKLEIHFQLGVGLTVSSVIRSLTYDRVGEILKDFVKETGANVNYRNMVIGFLEQHGNACGIDQKKRKGSIKSAVPKFQDSANCEKSPHVPADEKPLNTEQGLIAVLNNQKVYSGAVLFELAKKKVKPAVAEGQNEEQVILSYGG